MSRSILDDLLFMPAPLDHRATHGQPNIAQQFSVAATQKIFHQSVPLISLRPPMLPSDAGWAAYCGLLKDMGIPLQCSAASLEQLSIVNVPTRMAKRKCDEGFDLSELETADSIEIDCIEYDGDRPLSRLPLEVSGWHELKQMIAAVRDLAGTTTPIGMGLLMGDVMNDVANALAAGSDFIILHQSTASRDSEESSARELDLLAWGVAAARATAIQSGAPNFPIYVDCRLKDHDSLIKLLALGASAVSIDSIARSVIPKPSQSTAALPKGLLAGIGSLPVKPMPGPVPSLDGLEQKLQRLLDDLRYCLQQQHLRHLRELNRDHLRATSERASKLCHVRPLD